MRALVLFGLAACSYHAPSSPTGDDAPGTDAMPDMTVQPSADARLCFGSGFGMLCLATPPAAPLALTGNLDTGGTSCTEVIAGTCVLAGTIVSLASGTTFTATGDRPLIVVAADIMTITGTLSVASHRGQTSGAGAATTACVAPTPAEDDGGGGGGGAGGSFVDLGGTGGIGDTNDNNGSGGVANGGLPAPALTPTSLRAGCAGGPGGDGSSGNPGEPGDGGGAVYLIAGTHVTIDGAVDAGGAGANAPNGGSQGGAGGGSGGLVAVDAPMITITGILAANGGSGSGGSGTTNNAGSGNDGIASTLQASGGQAGTGGGGGGTGGNGSANTVTQGGPATNGPGGGGGGGGGAGYIFLKGTVGSTGTFSPAPVKVP